MRTKYSRDGMAAHQHESFLLQHSLESLKEISREWKSGSERALSKLAKLFSLKLARERLEVV